MSQWKGLVRKSIALLACQAFLFSGTGIAYSVDTLRPPKANQKELAAALGIPIPSVADGGVQVPLRIAINGPGRTGRAAIRYWTRRHFTSGLVQIVAVNGVAGIESKNPDDTLKALRRFVDELLYDTVYQSGLRDEDERLVKPAFGIDSDGQPWISLNGYRINVYNIRTESKAGLAQLATQLPWKKDNIDLVIESTGKMTDRSDASVHLQAGARQVLVSAPMKGALEQDVPVLLGVNQDKFNIDSDIFSCASCTTNALAPAVKAVHDALTIEHGGMITVHAVTDDQRLLDGAHKDPRRGRAAPWNIVPTSTGAARQIGQVIPELKGKMNGVAMRVPVPDGSIVGFFAEVSRPTTKEEVNQILRKAAEGPLKGIMTYSEEDLVSSRIIGRPEPVVDGKLTDVIDGTQIAVWVWYDNEFAFSGRMLDTIAHIARTRQGQTPEPETAADGGRQGPINPTLLTHLESQIPVIQERILQAREARDGGVGEGTVKEIVNRAGSLLVGMGDARTIEELSLRLNKALGENKISRARAIGKLLILASYTSTPSVRSAYEELLGEILTLKDVPLLQTAVDDEQLNGAVREVAERALAKIAVPTQASDGGVEEALNRLRFGQLGFDQTVEKLVGLGNQQPAAVERILTVAKDEEHMTLRLAAIKALSEIDDARIVPGLSRLFLDESEEGDVRLASLEALASHADHPDVLPLLRSATEAKEGYLRETAQEALAQLQRKGEDSTGASDGGVDEIVKGMLRANLDYSDAVEVLLQMNLPAEDLIAALESDTWLVRLVAVEVLGETVDPNAIPALRIALRDQDPRVQLASKEALRKIEGRLTRKGPTEAEDGGGREQLFPSLQQPLSRAILKQAQNKEAPTVVGYDIAYFAANPDAYLNYALYRERDKHFGKVGSGIVTVFLPYAIRAGSPELLQGIDAANLPAALTALNAFVSQQTGREVHLTPDDFGLVVPSEKLLDPIETREYIEFNTGFPMTRLFARRSVAEAFSQIMSVVTLVFELPFESGKAVTAGFEEALMRAIGEGPEFVNPSVQDVSGQAAEALDSLRNTLTKL